MMVQTMRRAVCVAGILLPWAVMAQLLPPAVGVGWLGGWVREWRGEIPGLEITDSTIPVSEGVTKVVRRWTWRGKEPLEEVTLAVRYRMAGTTAYLKPYLPGILMYGNPSNRGRKDGRVPVYAGEPDEFAIFEEHRYPMPFALLEDVKTGGFAALHTLPSPLRGAKVADLWWSLGIEANGSGCDIVILSGPVGYNRHRSVVKALQRDAMAYDNTYITLYPGQVIEKTFWIETGKTTKEAFGFEQAMDLSLALFKPYDTERYAPFDQIVRTKRNYALTRWTENPALNACGFNMYDRHHNWRALTIGWCGCAATCGYALPVLDLEKGDWEKAQRSLDFLCETFSNHLLPHGLFQVTYDLDNGKTSGGDPVSCGQGLYSVLKAIRFAERSSNGRLNPAKWRAFAAKVADAAAGDILRDDWREPASTGPGFLIAPLVLASELFGKPDYLAAAKKLAAVFERKYFGYDGVYWGGTLDASCEDKEGAYAAFQGYLALLDQAVRVKDGAAEARYARLARHAMNVMLSYTMVWDVTYPAGRLSDHAFKSTGWTVVSAQNQHLDAFAVLATPEVWRMGVYLKDDRLKRLAAVMFRSCFQLTDASGALGEQIQHTNFAQHGDMRDVYKLRGGYHEQWTVFWLTAHFLNAAAQFKELGAGL
ncbi:MAG: hypothetical protein J6334_10135 [Kiritimatiellae bacterium]|nr:hypothetical protein [Kiritimatiellia bacterium]